MQPIADRHRRRRIGPRTAVNAVETGAEDLVPYQTHPARVVAQQNPGGGTVEPVDLQITAARLAKGAALSAVGSLDPVEVAHARNDGAIDKAGLGLPGPENAPQVGLLLAAAVASVDLGAGRGGPAYFDAVSETPLRSANIGRDARRSDGGGGTEKGQRQRVEGPAGSLGFHILFSAYCPNAK